MHAYSNITDTAADKEGKRKEKKREKSKRKIHTCGPEYRQGALPDRTSTWSTDGNPAGGVHDGCKTVVS
mgnify:FL=1